MSATDLTTTEVLTIEEAATLLRISRNAAYAAARQWRATGGETGIPCIEIGRTLRVPRADLDKLLGREPRTEVT
ncbi:MAG: helix-turn-helix domain-containing protein [Microthrixaceae bacterium]|nr:helix-turn-helix domain-containing protein [Microthrixaceae bacterium]